MTTTKAVRTLVGRIANVNPKEIKLEGVIPPDFKSLYETSSWIGSDVQEDTILGINLKESASKKLDIARFESHNYNGNVTEKDGQILADYLEGTGERYDMFLVNSVGKGYGEDTPNYDTWTLYKAPNFGAYWESVTKIDIQRWYDWLNAE